MSARTKTKPERFILPCRLVMANDIIDNGVA